MSTPTESHTDADSQSYLTLNAAQREIRDAYLDSDAGLHVMSAVPGAGKSVTVADIAAREILQRYADGEPAPVQPLTVLSFNAEQADQLPGKIATRLDTLVTHDATPAASAMNGDDLAALKRRVRQTDAIGTVDGLLRDIFADIVAAVGFDEMPAVGDDLHLQQLHRELYARLASDKGTGASGTALSELVSAYPRGDYEDGLATLFQRGLTICRQQRLSTEEFREQLLDTLAAVYPDGPPADATDLVADLQRVLEDETADALAANLDDADVETVVTADADLYADWNTAIEDFARYLDAYRDRYRAAIRAEGVLSHTDVAYIVASFLEGEHPAAADSPDLRKRVLGRYRQRLQSLIIDEAQDIATIQHDALAPLVGDDTRVFLAGDLRQSIYVWRDARPSLFAAAIEEGQYFGESWDRHRVTTTTTTYRSRPAIAGAIDAICEPALTDDERGNLATFDIDYPRLDADREATADASVHVAGFDPPGPPGVPWYVADDGDGEAPALAHTIAAGLERGAFGDNSGDDDQPSVMVLFRWRTHMDAYREAFEAAGLSVANAAAKLFAADSVRAVLAVLDWLVDPTDSDHLQTLVRADALDLAAVEPALRATDWSLDTLLTDPPSDDALAADDRALLEALHSLQQQAPTLRTDPMPAIIRTIIDTLELRADSYDLTESAPDQRVATCDALIEYVADVANEADIDLDELLNRLKTVREAPHTGPAQPLPATEGDVVFRTIHQAKGDEADVVALADPGFPLRKHGPVGERLVSAPGVTALAPPVQTAGTVSVDGNSVDLSPHLGGLYTPTADMDPHTPGIFPREGGLRWASERWGADGLVGSEHLQQAVAARRAESWRLLYVALTRARDHLVLPLPWSIRGEDRPRDRWVDTLIDGLGVEGVESGDEYALEVAAPNAVDEGQEVTVNVLDGDAIRVDATETDRPGQSAPTAASRPVDGDALPPLVPRFVRPSTLKPLADAPEEHLLAHLQQQPIHSAASGIDPDLPLSIDALDADAIGTIVHHVVTRAITAGLDAATLRGQESAFMDIVETALKAHDPLASEAERTGLVTFLTEYIVPDLLESQLWADVQRAIAVYTEMPLRGEYVRDGTVIEVEGQADVVLRLPDNTWKVVDLKVALTEPDADPLERYQVQAALYADLFGNCEGITAPVTAGLQTVGDVRDHSQAPWPDIDINATLEQMAESNGAL